ncbi:leucyl-tRNA synthetase [Xylariaceae sp. FL1272]|nr:leucyl-tRNA synthetase [Xylariaceae sp. FL1272]
MYSGITKLARPGIALKLPPSIPVRTSITLRRCYASSQLDLPTLDRAWRQRWSENKANALSKPDAHAFNPSPALESESDVAAARARHMYILSMFPYPSGNLHLGHLRVYTIADVVARYHRLKGRNVLLPMGWDAFGLPAENAAIERGIDPSDWTRDNIARMKEQLEVMNANFDWSRELATCDPNFYKHTQKLFLQMYKDGLVTRQRAVVNWDPVDKTVLANEQVDSEGRSWRSGALVEQKPLEQWFFRITEFKEALLRDLDVLAKENNWPERVLTMQKNWLGKSIGARYRFPLEVENQADLQCPEHLEIYTTRPETIFGVQFIAISPDSKLAKDLADSDPQVRAALETVRNGAEKDMRGYRVPHILATNPISRLADEFAFQAQPLPIFIAPYVRGDYETGAVMGVPAHDARDFAFWKQNSESGEVKYAVTPDMNGLTPQKDGPYLDSGYMTALAGKYRGSQSEAVVTFLVDLVNKETGLAEIRTKWKLRDWLISRQRYWGTPIPIVHCRTCGPQPVPDDQLPVKLPKVDHHWAGGRAGNPLESATDWVNTSCPKCHGPGKRDTDTMDTFVDSSWYYMRFADPHNSNAPVSELAAKTQLPVDIYIGGVEHAILHLLYARFFYKAFMGTMYPKQTPEGLPEPLKESSHEPFKRLITQGMVHGKTYLDPDNGRFLKPDEVDLSNPSQPKMVGTGKQPIVTYEKMSKSKYNGVDPTTFIGKYGADATRAHILFQAPVGEVLNWDENKITGVTRWLSRVHEHVQNFVLTTDRVTMHWIHQNPFNSRSYFAKERRIDLFGKQAILWEKNMETWRAVQMAIADVTTAYEKVYPLNTAVSTLMSLTNAIMDNTIASDLIRFEALTVLIRLMAPIAPAFAEECWSILRPGSGMLFDETSPVPWPVVDGSLPLLQVDHQPCTVAIDGKKRYVLEIPKPAGIEGPELTDWFNEQVLQAPEVQKRLHMPEYDVRRATKMFLMKGNKGINYLMPKESK